MKEVPTTTINLDDADCLIVRDILERHLVTCQDAIRECEEHPYEADLDLADWWKNRAARTEAILKRFEGKEIPMTTVTIKRDSVTRRFREATIKTDDVLNFVLIETALKDLLEHYQGIGSNPATDGVDVDYCCERINRISAMLKQFEQYHIERR